MTIKMSKAKAQPKSEPFETTVRELERRVDMLEREDLDLTRAIAVFKECVELAKRAQSKLDEAQSLVTAMLEDELKKPR